MTTKLVYHTAESITGETSPFDEAIHQIIKDDYISIACPYLSLNYLQHITKNCRFWRLLTDVEAWLSSSKSIDRQAIQDFIGENSDRVHHYKNLHAKMIVGEEKALVGSANFTKKGITERIELSVFFDKEKQIEELRQWFDNLWQQTSSIEEKELSAYVQALPDIEISKANIFLSFNAPGVKAKFLNKIFHRQFAESEDEHRRLVERVKLAPSREWIDDYFNLVQELLAFTKLNNDDPRLVLSIPKTDKSLPLMVNSRCVLAAVLNKNPLTCYTFGSDTTQILKLIDKAHSVWQFSPLRGEKRSPPKYLRFDGLPSSVFLDETNDEIKADWCEAVLAEMKYGTYSTYRRHHKPMVYKVVVNLEYRKKVLDEAFPIIV